jgi:hypothetical protein
MKKTKDKKEYRRAQAVIQKSEGKTHKAIAEEHGVDERTTQRWTAAYVKKGIEGLQICRNSRSILNCFFSLLDAVLTNLFLGTLQAFNHSPEGLIRIFAHIVPILNARDSDIHQSFVTA